ncbi:MAG TPA: hypothetical protein ENJ82_09450 [Bacteroidetes bacterium]|nr:hypothetical protein [Bacteroidota bacterium]
MGDEVEDMFLQRHAKAVFMSVRKKSTGFYGQILMMPYAYLTGLDKSLISKNKARSMEEYLKLHEDLQDVFAEKMKQLFP